MTPTLKLAVFAVVATLAYLGLAILGWGGFIAFFSHPPLIALASTLFVLTGAALFSGGNLSPGEREDRTNRWVIAAFGAIGVLAAYLPAYTDRKEFCTIDGDAVRWLGVALFAAGGALRLWPVFVLGHRFSRLVAIQPGHRLVTGGFVVLSVTPAISGCWSTRWAGLWPFARLSACCSPHCWSRRSSPAFAPKKDCCALSSATSTTPTATAPRG